MARRSKSYGDSNRRRKTGRDDFFRYSDYDPGLDPSIETARARFNSSEPEIKPTNNTKRRSKSHPMLFRKPDVHSSQHVQSIFNRANGKPPHNHDPLRFTVLGPLETMGKVEEHGLPIVKSVFERVVSSRSEGFDYTVENLFVTPLGETGAQLGVIPSAAATRELNLDIRQLNQQAESKWNDFEHGSRIIGHFYTFKDARFAALNTEKFLKSTDGVLCHLSGVILAPDFK